MIVVPPRFNSNALALVGPSGGGKTSIGKAIIKTYGEDIKRCITVTSRSVRGAEKHYSDYIYLCVEGFIKVKEEGLLYECENPFGTDWYGTPKGIFDAIVSEGKSPLLNIDIKGFRSLKKLFGKKIFGVFIDTPIEEVRYFLELRGDTPQSVIERRLQRALTDEYPFKHELDYIQLNNRSMNLDIIANSIINNFLQFSASV